MEHTNTRSLYAAFDSLRRAHRAASRANPYCPVGRAVLYWGGEWMTLGQGARAILALSYELRMRTGWDPPFWSTVKEYGQSGWFYDGSAPVSTGAPYVVVT